MDEIKIIIDDIKKYVSDISEPKIKKYIKMLEHINNQTPLENIVKLKKNLELERKTISITLKKNSFNLFVKYDNIYREMISAVEIIFLILKKQRRII